MDYKEMGEMREGERIEGELNEERGYRKKGIKRRACEFLIIVGVMVGLGYVFMEYEIYTVEGTSMYPTIEDGDVLVVDKGREIERQDIVVVDHKRLGFIIKRVIGVGGDRINYREGVLHIDGKPVEEPYVDYWEEEKGFEMKGNLWMWTGEWEVPEGRYLVLGDNRMNSTDSRVFGFIDKEEIRGKYIGDLLPYGIGYGE